MYDAPSCVAKFTGKERDADSSLYYFGAVSKGWEARHSADDETQFSSDAYSLWVLIPVIPF